MTYDSPNVVQDIVYGGGPEAGSAPSLSPGSGPTCIHIFQLFLVLLLIDRILGSKGYHRYSIRLRSRYVIAKLAANVDPHATSHLILRFETAPLNFFFFFFK